MQLDPDGMEAGVFQAFSGDPLGQGLDQVALGLADQGQQCFAEAGVIDGQIEVVGGGGRGDVEIEADGEDEDLGGQAFLRLAADHR